MQKNQYTGIDWDTDTSDKWQQKRQQRLNDICDILKTLKVASLPEFVAKLAITSGIRSYIIRIYLNEIKTAGLITIKKNVIYWNNQSDTFQGRV